jgi:hypothetical protein
MLGQSMPATGMLPLNEGWVVNEGDVVSGGDF